MAKCVNPQCNVENPEGSKFCLECGTPIPQTVNCKNCGDQLPPNSKFCPNCGTPASGEAPAHSGLGGAGDSFSIGEKNVIAGDVVGKKEDFKVEGTANIYKNTIYNMEDDQKKVLICAICGKNTPNAKGYTCPECGKFVCKDDYRQERRACSDCCKEIDQQNEAEYLNILKRVYDDGQVNTSERMELDDTIKRLRISSYKAKELEEEVAKNRLGIEDGLTKIEQHNYQKAKVALYKKFDLSEADELVVLLWKNHPENRDIQVLYLNILKDVDSEKTLKIVEGMKTDLKEAVLVTVDVALRKDDFRLAEITLQKAKVKWPDDYDVELHSIEFELKFGIHTKETSCYSAAQKRLSGIWDFLDPKQKSYAFYIKAMAFPNGSNSLTEGDPESELVDHFGDIYRESQKHGCEPYWFLRYGAILIKSEDCDDYSLRDNFLEDSNPLTSDVFTHKGLLLRPSLFTTCIAALMGNELAINEASKRYSEGSDVSKNASKAKYWLDMAEAK